VSAPDLVLIEFGMKLPEWEDAVPMGIVGVDATEFPEGIDEVEAQHIVWETLLCDGRFSILSLMLFHPMASISLDKGREALRSYQAQWN